MRRAHRIKTHVGVLNEAFTELISEIIAWLISRRGDS